MTKNKKGFTIIEVVLVLAIAGLIFLMVFIALPALQRSQRNTQRQDDLARVLTQVNSFQSNNNGKVPFGVETDISLGTFVTRYIDKSAQVSTDVTGKKTGTASFKACGAEFKDPQGDCYKISKMGAISATTDVSSKVNEKNFHGYTNASCGDEGVATKGSGVRDVAVFMKLEGGSIACNDNH